VLWASPPTPEGLDAIFAPPAPDHDREPSPPRDDATEPASSAAIVDISRPAHPARLLERAIAAITKG
jgi:hypothetical protein